MIKKALKTFFIVIAVLILLFAVLLKPVDKTPVSEKPIYLEMMNVLDSMTLKRFIPSHPVQCGWSKVNLMPEWITPMAGYAPKDAYEEVKDSLYVRTIIMDNGATAIALISLDLLITPPLLADALDKKIKSQYPHIDYLYFSASHTHNGIGGWDNSIGGQLMTGNFDEEILDHIVSACLQSIKLASANQSRADLKYLEIDATDFVGNRLDKDSAVDGIIRGIEFNIDENEKGILFTYSAHATNIPRKSRSISNDYPGAVINLLEEEYNFAQFMAGSVGSHRLQNVEGEGFEKVHNAGKILSELVLNSKVSDIPDSIDFSYLKVNVKLDHTQMRIGKNIALRNWAFETFFNPIDAPIRILKLGNTLMLGMPCDFSGELLVDEELYKFASDRGINLIVTSFNGDYIGYITEDSHYFTSTRSEVMNMNWVGPYHGAYFTDIVKKIILKASK